MAANPALSRLAAGEALDAPAARAPGTEGAGNGSASEHTPGASETPTGSDAQGAQSAQGAQGTQGAPDMQATQATRGVPGGSGIPGKAPAWQVARVVSGSVVTTGLAGMLFTELRRRGGLAAPAMFHVATNSLGYLFARLAPPDRAHPVHPVHRAHLTRPAPPEEPAPGR
ncbi:hypothetical protein GCM10018952_34640 [Streptosporangium vulgare]